MSTKHYKPTESEQYMSPEMVTYFETWLIGEKSSIEANIKQHTEIMTQKTTHADILDAASVQSERDLGSANREQASKKLAQCKKALQAVKDDEYGYCAGETCGEEIGVGRLLINPAFTLCFECADLEEKRPR